MKILVTGGAGYIGSVASEQLLDQGHEVVIFDSLERGHLQAVDSRARFVRGDLRIRDDITKAMAAAKPDAVMHFAAYALVGESMEFPLRYFGNNVVGCTHLVEAMLASDVRRIIFSSTCATYGQPERMPMTELMPQKPTNPYGESKLMCETMLRWAQERNGLKPVFLRYFNACGATAKLGEDHDPESHIIPNILAVALGKKPHVTVFGDDYETPDGTCIRDYIHIVDLAQAHILAMQSDRTGAYNLGNGDGFSVMQVIEMARQITGHPLPVKIGPRRPGDPARLVASAQKAKTELKWSPQYGLRAIMEHAWAWHKAHPNGYGK